MLIVCSKHGLQPGAWTSPLVSRLVSSKQLISEALFSVKLYVDVLEIHAFFWSDLAFVDSLRVPYSRKGSSILIKSLGEEKSFEVYAKIVGTCKGCYEGFLTSNKLLHADEAYEQNPVT